MAITAARSTVVVAGTEVSLLTWHPDVESHSTSVLLLHGGGLDSAHLSWGGIGPVLAATGYRVLAADHPGFGESAPAPWTITQENLVAYVGGLVDALNLQDYVVGGLSLGGGMTLGHLLHRPGRAKGAMLLGCYGVMPRLFDGPFGAAAHTSTWAMLKSGLLDAMTRSYATNPSRMERGLHDLIRDPAQRTPELVADVLAQANGTGLATFGAWQHDQVLWNRLRTDYSSRLSQVTTPTLVIHGTKDTGVPIARATAAARALPNARLVPVENAGHWVQRDSPAVVGDAMVQWLGALN